MRLYHATKKENIESIKEFGIEPKISKKISHNKRHDDGGVYGFISLKNAIDFALDNCYDYFVVFAFESDNYIDDPEYDENESKIDKSGNNIFAELVYDSEEN